MTFDEIVCGCVSIADLASKFCVTVRDARESITVVEETLRTVSNIVFYRSQM